MLKPNPGHALQAAQPVEQTRARPLHVLHVLGCLDRGGAEMRTIELLRRLEPTRVRFSFLTLSGRAGALDAEARSLGAEIHPLRLAPGFTRGLQAITHSKSIDVIQSHVHYSSGFVLRQAARVGIRNRIAHFRSSGDGQRDSLRRSIQRRIMRRWIDLYATEIAAVSQSAMESAWGAGWRQDSRCKVVYNGLDVRAFGVPAQREAVRADFGFGAGCPLFIHVGSIQPAKNHRHLVDVFTEIVRRDDRSRLVIVGRDGGLAAEVRRQISALNLGRSVAMAGERQDVPRLLKAADVMVFPSRREGLPGAVLEGCAAGLGVVGSDIPSLLEIARHFPDVQCLPLGAPISTWADAAESLLRTRWRRDSPEYADRAFEATPFDMARVTAAYMALIGLTPDREQKTSRP